METVSASETTNCPGRGEYRKSMGVGGPKSQTHSVTLAGIPAVWPPSCTRWLLCSRASACGHGLAKEWRRDLATKEISRYLTPATASMGDYP